MGLWYAVAPLFDLVVLLVAFLVFLVVLLAEVCPSSFDAEPCVLRLGYVDASDCLFAAVFYATLGSLADAAHVNPV